MVTCLYDTFYFIMIFVTLLISFCRFIVLYSNLFFWVIFKRNKRYSLLFAKSIISHFIIYLFLTYSLLIAHFTQYSLQKSLGTGLQSSLVTHWKKHLLLVLKFIKSLLHKLFGSKSVVTLVKMALATRSLLVVTNISLLVTY